MKLAIIGDFNPSFKPHVATNDAIAMIAPHAAITWMPTDQISAALFEYQGFWIAPGSPYKSMAGALEVIRYAREFHIPTLGTCGGFQHMVIEFARNVLHIEDAMHAEYDPYASKLVVNPLSCSLAGQEMTIELTDPGSITYAAYGQQTIKEKYYCNFGLNPAYQDMLAQNGFRTVGTDSSKEARILELQDHPFFIATLFVPQDVDYPHPLIQKFLGHCSNL